MGYNTDFEGHIDLGAILTHEQCGILHSLCHDDHRDNNDMPGIWCQWELQTSDESMCLEWDGIEKFYNYVEWMKYILDTFIIPWGYTANGVVTWIGEDRSDLGRIVVINNKLQTNKGYVVYE